MSELSKLSYWDSLYERDLDILKESGDIGEIWFGEHVERKVIESIEETCDTTCKCIDIGCGNGSMTAILSEMGYYCVGVDYSQKSIEMCAIAFPELKFFRDNILTMNLDEIYNVVVDKGTLDAIYLSRVETDVQLYVLSVLRLLESKGYLFITSCNLIKSELTAIFSDMILIHEIPYPIFEFGGAKGQCVTSLVFQKQ